MQPNDWLSVMGLGMSFPQTTLLTHSIIWPLLAKESLPALQKSPSNWNCKHILIKFNQIIRGQSVCVKCWEFQ